VLFLFLVTPLVLLGALLLLEWLERPMYRELSYAQLRSALKAKKASEIESLVSDSYSESVDRYWRRRRLLARLRVGRMSDAVAIRPRRARTR
jgi:hypothetical protein